MPGAERATLVLGPLDLARRRLLRPFAPIVGPLARDRELRIVVGFGLVAALATTFVLLVPRLSLLLVPLILGVPHLAADVRYLVLRRGLLARGAVVAAVLAPSALAFVSPPLRVAGLLLGGAALVARGPFSLRGVVGLSGAGLVAASVAFGPIADAAFAHGHHAIALIAFVALAPRRPGTIVFLVASVVLASLVVVTSVSPERVAEQVGVAPLLAIGGVLAPGAAPRTAAVVVAVYALHQAMHYGLWLRLVPDAVRERSAPRTFAASHRALVEDFGTAGLAFVVGASLVVAALVLVLPAIEAREHYLRLALFHGPLEVGLLGLALAEGRRP